MGIHLAFVEAIRIIGIGVAVVGGEAGGFGGESVTGYLQGLFGFGGEGEGNAGEGGFLRVSGAGPEVWVQEDESDG